MALVMSVLMFATLLGLAAFSAARGGTNVSAGDRDRKQSFAAAEAGINWYLSRLNQNNDYWGLCGYQQNPTSGVSQYVNSMWQTGADFRNWHTMAGTTAEFAIEVLPVDKTKPCSTSNMIDSTGRFRIRSTGRYRGIKRTLVASFRRVGFLDFIYLTNYETTDPLAYPAGNVAQANTDCADKYRPQRNQNFCSEIQFAPGDNIRGPLHSNDSLLICGSATFGRAGKGDKVESGLVPGRTFNTGATCTGSPTYNSPFVEGADSINIPESNGELATAAQANGYYYTGQTAIVLNGTTMTITNNGTTVSRQWPSNGLIFVDTGSGTCTGTNPPRSETYSETANCAIATVSGSYSKPLTIASAKDVLIRNNLTKDTASSQNPILGLIANQFVRVWHPVNRSNCISAAANTTPIITMKIDAAILSLQHSFTVDNYDCGTGFGNLSVTGAISQKYRGAVGTSGVSNNAVYRTGYVKDYVYDDELKYRNPPLFLDPVDARWKVNGMSEQLPAR
jgi:hypothetical protein